ncbi:hypothetical protein LCGC14_2049920 [marine sediment metagenome]|uniref:Uncharacterized protein n=1 Tax=marine sediment metagenome TaxID=412755 RepID=A0A0F9HLB7_9ZZZZ
METLAIVFAILALVFVIDLARLDQIRLGGHYTPDSYHDISAVLALGCTVAAATLGVLAAV